MNPIIFLDIHGVLRVNRPERDEHGALFHESFVDNLRAIVAATRADIVISAGMRHSYGLEGMRALWRDRALPGTVVGVTPNLARIIIVDGWESLQSPKRGEEIAAWLQENSAERYVIIDGNTDMFANQLPFFVKTSNNLDHEDAVEGYGLTAECAKRVIGILTENNRP